MKDVLKFLLFIGMVIFYWIPDTIIFTFLRTDYFCIPTNIFGFCFRAQVNYMEKVQGFLDLALNSVMWA